MVVSDDSGQGGATAQEKSAAGQSISTQGREDSGVPGATPPAPLRPAVKYRRPFQILIVLLIILIILTTIRVSSILSSSDDQLLIQIGDQKMGTVDLRQNMPISPYLFGVNTFPGAGTSSLDEEHSGFMSYSPPIVTGLQSARIKLLRFPGGNWGEDHLLSYDQLDSFSTLLSQVGAEGMVQARLSGPTGHSGQYVATLLNRANLAGNWVDYMSNPHSSFRSGKHANAPFHPIKFWTVGNEPDRLINPDTGRVFTVAEYINDFILFSIAMHQNNPSIQVFGPELSQFYGIGTGPADANGQLWMDAFLKGVSEYEKAHPELKFHLLDGISFHFYPLVDSSRTPATLLSSVDEWNYLLPPLRQLIREDFARDVPVAVTEINTNPNQQVYSRGITALWWADTLGTLMSQSVEHAAFFSAEGVNTPYPLFTTDGLRQTPVFRAQQLFSYLQRNLVPVATQHDPISLYATQDDAHQVVSLLFVNKSQFTQLAQVSAENHFLGVSAWHNQDITLAGYSITLVTLHRGGGAEAYSYRVPANDDAAADPLTHVVCGHRIDALDTNIPC